MMGPRITTAAVITIAFILLSSSFFVLSPANDAHAQTAVSLTVATQYANGNSLSGMWTVLQSDGTTIASGFSPVTFTVEAGAQYAVVVGDYQDITFYQWQDTGSTTASRSISISSSTTITALYTSPSNPPPDDPDPPDDPEPPPPSGEVTLQVATQYANGNSLSGMWTVLQSDGTTVDSGFSPVTFTVDAGVQYTVAVGDYNDITFYQWQDTGSTTASRSISISSSTTITALYTSPSNPPPDDPEPPPPSGAPTVQPVSANTIENSQGTSITLQGSDPAGLPLTYYVVTQPSRGAVSSISGNVIWYTPFDWHDGQDSFTYAAHNGEQSSEPATVTINVQDVGSKTTSRIVVISQYEDNLTYSGLWTVLSQGGTTINNGFTQVHFSVNNSQQYTVTLPSNNFVHWQDTGSTSPTRTINISQDTGIIAVYSR